MNETDVDIIVPTYNRSDLLPETLKSVQDQTFSNWQCWIAEDG
ncbi:MAG: glycosyltransferase, partial [Proteobacteria bacterium]|nr:glycosyltransferase [Pseudomonadota bacterium]